MTRSWTLIVSLPHIPWLPRGHMCISLSHMPCPPQAQGDVEQRHAGEVARLKDAISTLEKSERQLLKARAVLEARVEELGAELEGARRQAAAAAQSTQLAVEGAVAAATTQLQCQVSERGRSTAWEGKGRWATMEGWA